MDVASFLPVDPDVLVRASLSCSFCLSGEVAWSLADDGAGFVVRCLCQQCDNERTIGLTDDQALRLTIAPPG